MARFCGIIGYVNSVEQLNEDDEKTGIWVDVVTEQEYRGDVLRQSNQWTSSPDKSNDNISIRNRISIVADDFAYQNFSAMRYIKWDGVYWMVTDIEVQRPRLILTLGGVYNGPKN